MKKGIVISIAVLTSTWLFAQEGGVQEFSLKQAIDYAIKNNNAAKNAMLDMQKAKAYNWEILTTGLPQLSGSLEYDNYFKVPQVPALNQYVGPTSTFAEVLNRLEAIDNLVGPGIPATSHTEPLSTILNPANSAFNNISFVLPNDMTAGLQLTQLLFDARYMFGIKARKELYLTSRLSADLSAQDIRYNIIKAYNQAEAAQEAKSLLLDNQKIVDKLLSDTRAVFAQGLTEELDVNRLELVQANLQSQINQQNNLAEVAIVNLKFQMGLPLDEVILLKDKLEDLKSAAVPEQNKFDPQNRVEYQLLNTAITLKGYDMEQKRSSYYPSIVGFLNYSGNVQTETFDEMFKNTTSATGASVTPWFPEGIVGIKINVPIFDSGLKYAQVRQAKLEQMKAKNDFENFKNAAKLQYQSAFSTYTAALADAVNGQKTLDLAQKIFNKNQIKFKEGVGSSFELQQSEQEYATDQLKLIQSTMNLLNAKADLDKAMGVK